MEISFGTKTIKSIMDENGSTKSVEVNYASAESKPTFRVEYVVRRRVSSKEEEKRIVEEFTDKYGDGTTHLDPKIWVEHSLGGRKNGYYYIVTSWKELKSASEHPHFLELIAKV